MLRVLLLVQSFLLVTAVPLGPLTPHFQEWLNNNGFASYKFARSDLGQTGSYGGRNSSGDKVKNYPIVFIHGNSDGALAIPGPYSSGWTNTISYFESQGYTSAELYVTTWGDRKAADAHLNTHSCDLIQRLRAFVDAVLGYTGADYIDIISHSMGVTLARKVIRGGLLIDPKAPGHGCNIGPSLASRVDTFIGISGANYGMCTCSLQNEAIFPTCNNINGFWPGDDCDSNHGICGSTPLPSPCTSGTKYSGYLTDLNTKKESEGNFVFSIMSIDDDIIMNHGMVWGRPTAVIPGSTQVKIFENYTHMETKELTAQLQYAMVVYHNVY
uniref:Lipase n=1 Tax=Steinernema glaseri TaxID=37863 RepID=A0A1I8A932_9BILA